MKYLLTFFALSIFFLVKVLAKDTTETKLKTEVVVEASKPSEQLRSFSFSSSSINSNELRIFGFGKANEALTYIPGVYIKDYGGVGGIKTISLRGFSGADAGILIDGVKINNQQNGLLDLTLIPLDFFDLIEVYRGGYSILAGSNSASGVVSFSTKKIDTKRYEFKLGLGSFNDFISTIQMPIFVFPNYSASIALNYFYSKGNYPIKINEFGVEKTYERQNSSIQLFSLFYNNKLHCSFLESNLKILLTFANRGVPGAVLQNAVENKNAKMKDKFILISYNLKPYILLDSNLNLSFNFIHSQNTFYDPDGIGILLKKNQVEYFNNEFTFKTSYGKNLKFIDFTGFAEYTFASLKGDMLDVSVNNYVHRNNFALGIKFTKFLFFDNYSLTFENGYRMDFTENLGSNLEYLFGILLAPKNEIFCLKANASSNLRLPTFNEMYYLNYGNTNLQPENTISFNFEVSTKIFPLIEPKISLFFNSTKNKIVSVPKSPIQWTAMNIAKTFSRGLEFSLSGNLPKTNFVINYSYILATDQTSNSPTFGKDLIYTPQHLANFLLNFSLPFGSFITFRGIYIGNRFSLPDNSKSSLMKEYSLLDIILAKDIEFNKKYRLNLSLQILNIFDVQYEVILNYPMPRRQLIFQAQVKF
jgi:outer membrane cobalamin receptor